jgi:hypothetical protein
MVQLASTGTKYINVRRRTKTHMAKHVVDYSYNLPEWGSELIDIDPDLNITEKEDIALAEIKDIYPELKDVSIDSVKLLIED